MDAMETSKKNEWRTGLQVFLGLAALTGLEYWAGVSEWPPFMLWAIAILKAALVAWFFMHIRRLTDPEGGEHA